MTDQPDEQGRASQRKRGFILDALFLIAVIFLAFLFYYPQPSPLKSTYMYLADSFERAGHVLNPDYGTTFKRFNFETFSPLLTLLARFSLQLFKENVERAVLVLYMGVALVAASATYILNRRFLSSMAAFIVTSLLFCGRVLLPESRFGMIQLHLLIPLSLLFLVAVPEILDDSRSVSRRAGWIFIGSASLAGVYLLGSHEPFYGAFCMGVAVFILAVRWGVRSICKRGLHPFPLATPVGTVVLACVLGIGGMAVVQRGIPEQQEPTSFRELAGYHRFLRAARADARVESFQKASFKLQVLRGTFMEGRYLTPTIRPWGSQHENCFLHPGPGFNGIVPLFLLPGLAIGLFRYFRESRAAVKKTEPSFTPGKRLFLLFLGVLLVKFAVMVLTVADPKPTRYTFSIYAIYVISVWGYEEIASWVGRFMRAGGLPNRESPVIGNTSMIAACIVFIPFMAFFTMRLNKNYTDLRTYMHEYSQQIPEFSLGPLLERALDLPEKQTVAIMIPEEVDPKWLDRHPAVGLKLGFRIPPNLHFVRTQDVLDSLPENTLVLRPETITSDRQYHLPKRRWSELADDNG